MELIVYRKCRCTVWPLDLAWAGTRNPCGKCGHVADEFPDYQDYVKARQDLAAARRHVLQLESYVRELQERINEGW